MCSPLRRAWQTAQNESREKLAARIRRALRGIAGPAGRADAVVIAHGASIRAAVPALQAGNAFPPPVAQAIGEGEGDPGHERRVPAAGRDSLIWPHRDGPTWPRLAAYRCRCDGLIWP